MIPYIHFAFNNLYLANGYSETNTSDGMIREYESPDKLEHCVRRLVIRKKEPLRGWDLRFLRRGLEISQAEFGKMVGRDAQSIARWEKSKENVPEFADIAIRLKFADRFEPLMTARELMDCIESRGQRFPDRIVFSLNNGEWNFELGSVLNLVLVSTHNLTRANLPPQVEKMRNIATRNISMRNIQHRTHKNIFEGNFMGQATDGASEGFEIRTGGFSLLKKYSEDSMNGLLQLPEVVTTVLDGVLRRDH